MRDGFYHTEVFCAVEHERGGGCVCHDDLNNGKGIDARELSRRDC